MVPYPWAALGYEAVFLHAQPGLRGRTMLRDQRIEIYVRRSDTARRTAFDLAHEIAHAFDFTRGDATVRSTLLAELTGL